MAIMKRMRATLTAMGAGGIGWSIFGMVSSAYSFAIAGTSIITLAVITGGIVSFFGLVMFGIMHKMYSHQEEKRNRRPQEHAKSLMHMVGKLLEELHARYEFVAEQGSFSEYLGRYLPMLHNQIRNPALIILLDNLSLLQDADLTKTRLTPIIRHFIDNDMQACRKAPTTFQYWEAALFGFVPAFTAFTGFTGGSVNLLFGVGLFAGFSAFPSLAIITLVAALCLSVYSAVKMVENMLEVEQEKFNYKTCRLLAFDIGYLKGELAEELRNLILETQQNNIEPNRYSAAEKYGYWTEVPATPEGPESVETYLISHSPRDFYPSL